jgi:hypothetical protein
MTGSRYPTMVGWAGVGIDQARRAKFRVYSLQHREALKSCKPNVLFALMHNDRS